MIAVAISDRSAEPNAGCGVSARFGQKIRVYV
jgi:hypothetical protein